MERERTSGMKIVQLVETVAFTGNVTSPAIDMGDAAEGNFAESLTYAVTIGTQAMTGTGTIEGIPEESDDGAAWNVVPDDLIVGGSVLPIALTQGIAIPAASASRASFRIGVISKKQHQRLRLEEEGTVTAGAVNALAVLQDFRRGAQASQPA